MGKVFKLMILLFASLFFIKIGAMGSTQPYESLVDLLAGNGASNNGITFKNVQIGRQIIRFVVEALGDGNEEVLL